MLLQATDSDSGVNARVMYHVTSSVGAPFSVNAATGQVFTTRQFGSGDPSRFDLTVYADNGRLGMVSNSARLAVTRSCHCHLRKYIIYIAHCSAASIESSHTFVARTHHARIPSVRALETAYLCRR